MTIGGNFKINDAVLEAIPFAARVIHAESHGSSAWSRTAKLKCLKDDGSTVYFFLKQVDGEVGKAQLEGEFVGMGELHKLSPEFAPEPYAYGKLKEGDDVYVDTYFLLMEFKDFAGNSMPNAAKLGKSLAELHDKSQSPNGMFGFPLTTYDGSKTQVVDWDPSWTSFFSKLLGEAYRHDIETNGKWDELDRIFQRTQTHLIPRLIGALETDGRSIKPCLIHGDLWDGNIGTDANTGYPFIFDAAVYYAHHEMELGIWRAERHQMRAMIYRKEYIRNMEPSEPVNEWDDRNLLYSVKTNLMHSACVVNSPARQLAYNDLAYLIDKYVPSANLNDSV